jgi:hypothetical protein
MAKQLRSVIFCVSFLELTRAEIRPSAAGLGRIELMVILLAMSIMRSSIQVTFWFGTFRAAV